MKLIERGSVDVSVKFGGVSINSGEYIYVDLDGILVSELNLIK
ncbi:hypothetical protein [Formosa sp. PL04]|nr:hypothetical protein [Formosa sp. PL04]MDW5288561.1 hypothetical protein [Formosa sp. PL04]